MQIKSNDLKSIARQFNFLDQNKTGKIHYAAPETEAALKEIFELTDEEVQKLKSAIQSIDEDGDGYVDYLSFVTAGMNHQILVSKQNLHSAFDAIAEGGVITIQGLIKNFQLAKPKPR